MKPGLIAMLIPLCICLSGCRSCPEPGSSKFDSEAISNPEPVFPKFDSEAVIKGAADTMKDYVASFRGKPVKFYGEIAPVLWSPAIRDLKPA